MTRTVVLIIRWTFIVIWIAMAVTCLSVYLFDPALFTAGIKAAFLKRFADEILLLYIVFSIVRGLTLLPSTPLVIAGTLLFREQPFLVLIVSISGILLSSSMIYFFSDFVGFSEYVDNHKPALTYKIRSRLERPSGFFFVMLWAFLPFIPTDAVCYVAGTAKMNFTQFNPEYALEKIDKNMVIISNA